MSLPPINANGFITSTNTDTSKLPDPDEVRRCEEWLMENQHLRIKAINRGCSSYGWKHVVEFDKSYVSNGAFLQACVNLGIPIKQQMEGRWYYGKRAGTLNGYVPLSKKIRTQYFLRINRDHEKDVPFDQTRTHRYV